MYLSDYEKAMRDGEINLLGGLTNQQNAQVRVVPVGLSQVTVKA